MQHGEPLTEEQVLLQNELLLLENRVLRSGASAARDAEIERLRERVGLLEAQLQRDVQAAEQRAKEAESDLRWLLNRLAHSPVGPLLRRYRGFRALVERWT